MEIRFDKLSDARHRVAVVRDDGSTDTVELDSRSFLRHDLAHYAVEAECGITGGFWGSVANGQPLSGDDLDGQDLWLAEALAGPVQTALRTGVGVEGIEALLARVAPQLDAGELAPRLHARLRRLRGHWDATPYGGAMTLTWPAPP